MTQLSKAIERAAGRIARPGAWTQGAMARDKEGRPVSPASSFAVCWCAVGAVMAELGVGVSNNSKAIHAAEKLRLKSITGEDFVARWNEADGRTQKQVVNLLRVRAIQLAGKGE